MERKIMEVLRRMQTVIEETQLNELKNVLNMVFAGCELAENTELQEVSKFLGHAKLDTTMIYCSVDEVTVKNHHRKYLSN